MVKVIYVLKGDPTPLARPRFNVRYNQPMVYDSQKNVKLVTGIQLRNQHGDLSPYEGPLALYATFYFPIAVKFRKKIAPGTPHKNTPDLDNLIKYLLDTAQEAGLFKNDSIVSQIISQKVYDTNPRSEFYFIELAKE